MPICILECPPRNIPELGKFYYVFIELQVRENSIELSHEIVLKLPRAFRVVRSTYYSPLINIVDYALQFLRERFFVLYKI